MKILGLRVSVRPLSAKSQPETAWGKAWAVYVHAERETPSSSGAPVMVLLLLLMWPLLLPLLSQTSLSSLLPSLPLLW